MTEIELENREDAWNKNGDPRKKALCFEKVSCSGCGYEFEDGDRAYISDVNNGLYCVSCDVPKKPGVEGTQKIATHVLIDYSNLDDREVVREMVENQYEKMGFNPDEMDEEITQEVDRRLGNLE